MNILIRVDCSTIIGMGHLMRCLALANVLQEHGARVIFVIKNPIKDNDFLKEYGFEIFYFQLAKQENAVPERDAEETVKIIKKLNIKISWLIVDHYGLDEKWETFLRSYTDKILVIDDLADRSHQCDILLDQNLHFKPHDRYHHLIPATAELLLGPEYALLRDDFQKFKSNVKCRDGIVKKILIFFGGGDYAYETMKALRACLKFSPSDISLDVIVGQNYSQQEEIKSLCYSAANIRYFCQANNIAELMTTADLAIGAGGVINWERCCMGLPSIVITVADNQVAITQNLALLGILNYLGKAKEVSENQLANALTSLLGNQAAIREMSMKAYKLVDGMGCKRVVKKLLDNFNVG